MKLQCALRNCDSGGKKPPEFFCGLQDEPGGPKLSQPVVTSSVQTLKLTSVLGPKV